MKLFRASLFVLFFALPFFASAQSVQPSCVITPSRTLIQAGDSIVVTWRSEAVTRGTISPHIGSVPPSGSGNLFYLTQTTEFVGTFEGPAGNARCATLVTVAPGQTGLPSGPTFQPIELNDTPVYPEYTPRNTTPDNIEGVSDLGTFSGTGSIEQEGGLVPCTGLNCNICHISSLVQNVINFLIGFAILLSVALFSWAGWLYLSSNENAGQIDRAKKIFVSVLIGFAIAISGWLVIQTLIKSLVDDDVYVGWNDIRCDLKYQAERLRQQQGQVGEWLNSILGTTQPAQYEVVTGECPVGTFQNGICVDGNGNKVADAINPTITTNKCPAGTVTYDDEKNHCLDKNNQFLGYGTVSNTVSQRVSGICSSNNIQTAASGAGYSLSSAQAGFLACVAGPESGCSGTPGQARTPGGQTTTASGHYQIVLGYEDDCHSLNINVCTAAARSAGYNASGDLNCSQFFSGGKCKPGQEQGCAMCRAAAASHDCNAAAAACLLLQRPDGGDWTADPRSSAQKQCAANHL